ncbi:hypothetical protein PVSEL_0503620 [Plasmodium vinckei]|uniref:Uncharacterized protein n=1 Tax=Plasmodium vinckei TaxID=5860 RepID=A0A6V7SK21_PLAVN|nr:hypothetical protein PVSEL_0503620 [Plasmodium vinckei]
MKIAITVNHRNAECKLHHLPFKMYCLINQALDLWIVNQDLDLWIVNQDLDFGQLTIVNQALDL